VEDVSALPHAEPQSDLSGDPVRDGVATDYMHSPISQDLIIGILPPPLNAPLPPDLSPSATLCTAGYHRPHPVLIVPPPTTNPLDPVRHPQQAVVAPQRFATSLLDLRVE